MANLVKHLDHRNVAKQHLVQIDIVNVTTRFEQNAKQEATVEIVGAISDLIKHLKKCLQNSDEMSNAGNCIDKQNADLQFAIEKCILQLSNKVGSGIFFFLRGCFLKFTSSSYISSVEFDEYY